MDLPTVQKPKEKQIFKQNVFKPKGRNALYRWIGQGEKDIVEAGDSLWDCFCRIPLL